MHNSKYVRPESLKASSVSSDPFAHPGYSTILELDNLLTTTEQEVVPLAFKNRSITDLVEKPYLKEEYNTFQLRELDSRACNIDACVSHSHIGLPNRGILAASNAPSTLSPSPAAEGWRSRPLCWLPRSCSHA